MTTDPHAAEYLAAVAGMAETYGIVPTAPVIITTGSKRTPMWNEGATVVWADRIGRRRHGTVIGLIYPDAYAGPIDADRILYRIKTRDPVTLELRNVEMSADQLGV
jgi:hypothetical protein